MVKVGIPQALLYYQYYPMWLTFFEALGAEVIVSPVTSQAMLRDGAARVVADTCLPVKAFIGHVLSLAPKCDLIFIPTIRSVRKNVYGCSKFLGLSEMTRVVVPEAPPILDIMVDVNKGRLRLCQAIYRLGKNFTADPHKIRQASLDAWRTHLNYRNMISNHRLTQPAGNRQSFRHTHPRVSNRTPRGQSHHCRYRSPLPPLRRFHQSPHYATP